MSSFEKSYNEKQQTRKYPKVYRDSSSSESGSGDRKNIEKLSKLDSKSVPSSEKQYIRDDFDANGSFEVDSADDGAENDQSGEDDEFNLNDSNDENDCGDELVDMHENSGGEDDMNSCVDGDNAMLSAESDYMSQEAVEAGNDDNVPLLPTTSQMIGVFNA